MVQENLVEGEFSTFSNSSESLYAGARKLSEVVGSTLGPMGKTVLYHDDYHNARSTKDGATVAKHFFLNDPIENMSSSIIKEATMNANNKTGDGTTTATVLACDLVMRVLEFNGTNKNQYNLGIKRAAFDTLDYLREKSTKLAYDDYPKIHHVATTSTNNNVELGGIIANAYAAVGKNGKIEIVDSFDNKTSFELVDGYVIPRGLLNNTMITDHGKRKAFLRELRVLVIEDKISHINDVADFVDRMREEVPELGVAIPLLIVCDEIEDEVLKLLNLSVLKNKLMIAVIQSPGLNLDRDDYRKDIAFVTGANVIGKSTGVFLSNAQFSDLGFVESAEIGQKETKFLRPLGLNPLFAKENNKPTVEEYLAPIKEQLSNEVDSFLKNKKEARVASIVGGIGFIRVGGATEFERQEIKDRIEDGVKAVSSAIKDGILPGGGYALLKAAIELSQNFVDHNGYHDFLDSLFSISNRILENADIDETNRYTIQYNLLDKEFNSGYNVLENSFVDDMVDSGIIDTFRSIEIAIDNAVSLATTFATTSFVIVNTKSLVD